MKIRPFFLLIFIVLAFGSSIAISQGNTSSGLFLGFLAAAGLYLVLVSGIRYHIRGEGAVPKQTRHINDDLGNDTKRHRDNLSEDIDADDILTMSVSLESGSFQKNKEKAFTFTFNPLESKDGDREPLYGL